MHTHTHTHAHTHTVAGRRPRPSALTDEADSGRAQGSLALAVDRAWHEGPLLSGGTQLEGVSAVLVVLTTSAKAEDRAALQTIECSRRLVRHRGSQPRAAASRIA